MHLCEECARKKGINISISSTVAAPEPKEEKQEIVPDFHCGNCGLAFSEFRTKGWLGCAECYRAFESEIDNILTQMHGSRKHKGKEYRNKAPRPAVVDIDTLRKKLDRAIKNEEFETAATLRDEINRLQQGKKSLERAQ